MDCSLPGSSVHGDSLAGLLEWVAMLSSRGSNPCLLCLLHCRASSLPPAPPEKQLYLRVCCHISCVQLCKPMDCSPPGSSVHEILQAKILEWVAISSSRGSSYPRNRTWVSCVSCTEGGFVTCWAIREDPGKQLYSNKKFKKNFKGITSLSIDSALLTVGGRD